MSELQAAMGLAVFDHIDEIIAHRKKAVEKYDELLDQTSLQRLKIRPETEWNYHYYPIIFNSEEQLLKVMEAMNSENIFPRRYFYPSLNTLNYVNAPKIEISESIAKRILCLPLSTEIKTDPIQKIVSLIFKN